MTAVYRRAAPAVGSPHRGGLLRCVVAFEPETFGEVRAFAVRRGVSFAEAVRELVETRLTDMEQEAAR